MALVEFPRSVESILLDIWGPSDRNLTDAVLNHGCWCRQLNTLYTDSMHTLGGQPVDELDSLCRMWKSARNCNDHHRGGTCFGEIVDDSYRYFYSIDTEKLICASNRDCQCGHELRIWVRELV